MSDLQRNKQLALDFLAAFSRSDPEALLAFLHDDLKWWISGSLAGLSGTYSKAQMREMMNPALAPYAPGGMTLTAAGITAEGDRVAVEARSHAALFNGKTYGNTYHFLFVIKDGKILEVKEYMDSHHAWEIFLQP